MLDDVISTGLQAVLAEIFESVDKDQLNVSLVGDIFKESHLELTDLRFKKSLLKDLNFPVEVKEGLVGKLVIQGLSGLMTGDPVAVTVSEVLVLLAPGDWLSDPEAGLAARRLLATFREMFANRYSEEFLEDALRVKMEDRRSLQEQNKLNRKLMRHICRKLLASLSITLQTVHMRFELPAGGLGSDKPVKNSAGVGGGGACDAIGVMLPTLSIRTCGSDHHVFVKFANHTPLDRVGSKSGGAGAPSSASSSSSGNRSGAGDKKNFAVVRKRAMLSSLQVYCDYGVDSYVTDIGAAVSFARNQATNPRSGNVSSTASSASVAAGHSSGAVAAARALRSVFLKKWKSERHALLFKPLGVEIAAELHQWDRPRGKPVVPFYRVNKLSVCLGDLQAVMDAEQGRVLGTVVREVVNLIRRSRFNRFVPQAFLPLRNLPPPKVRPPKAPRDGAPGGILPTVECWSWSAEIGLHGDQAPDGYDVRRKPRSASEAVLRGGFRKEGGAWARAMWRFAGACVRHDLRTSATRRLPSSLPSWDGSISIPEREAPSADVEAAQAASINGASRRDDAKATKPELVKEPWRLRYMSLYARTLSPREAKSIGSTRTPDVRRLGVPRGREPLSLEEMWELARVESYAPGDEVVFLRTAAKVSSHYEWVRNRRIRSASKGSAMTPWTAEDDGRILVDLDKLRIRRAAAKLAAKEAGAGAEGEESDEEDEEITRLEFFARDGQSLTQAATSSNPFSDDEDEEDDEDEDEEEDGEDEDGDGDENGGDEGEEGTDGLPGISIDANGGSRSTAGGVRHSLGDIVAKASASAGRPPPPSVVVVRTGGGGKKRAAVGSEVWAKLLSVPRVVIEVASIGIELRTCISGGSRRPLVSLSANGLSGTVEGDEVKRMLWWELSVGKVFLRDLCSSWGVRGGGSTTAPPAAKTLLSGFSSGTEGREWAAAGDATGTAARSFFTVRVVHDPNRFTCSLFPGSAASLAELRAHVVVGSISGKIPPQLLKVFNAAARDVLVGKTDEGSASSSVAPPLGVAGANDSARQLRVAVTAIHEAISAPVTVSFKSKKKRGPRGTTKVLSVLKGAIARSSGGKPSTPSAGKPGVSEELVDSKELYKMVAGMLPGDFELRAHSSEILLQVESRAEDLLEAGKVGFEAIGERDAAARMQRTQVASEEIQLEVNVAPAKLDLSRSSHPSPELVLDTGAMRSKLRAPDKAVEAVVTALLSSAQRTKAAMTLFSHDFEEKIS